MSIAGKKRETTGGDFSKKVGLVECKIIAINPSEDEMRDKLGIELKEGSKATDYLGENKDGNKVLRIDVWVQQITKSEEETPFRNKITFFLEDKERENKDGTKNQYINSVGMCSWADDPNNLQEWFTKGRDYRVAYSGEEDLYNFLRTWLCELDYRHAETEIIQDWKKLMKGNVKDLRDQIDGEWCGNIVVMATVKTSEKDGEVKEYQSIYNRAFLPAYSLKNFRLVDYSKSSVIEQLSKKQLKNMKPHEKFVMNLIGEYGCKEYYVFQDIQDYDPDANLVASDKVISEDDAEY